MSSRRAAAGRQGIRGPQSALTDFLAANNISARQIRDTVDQRVARAREQVQAEGSEDVETPGASATAPLIVHDEDEDETAETPSISRSNKRKRKDQKADKAAAKKKAKKGKGGDDDDDDDSDFDLSREMYQKSKPAPGQFEHCEMCEKRFTVTPYSKEGPDGGLLCPSCGKQFAKDNKSAEAKDRRKAGAAGRKRRQHESNRLDGIVRVGARSLVDICVERIARHHGDVEELGDLPDTLVDRLSQIFSKKRVLTPDNLNLFLRPDLDTVSIHDAANLNENDFKQIFAIAPHVTKLILRNAGQLKDSCLAYMSEKATEIRHFQVYGANLVTDQGWSDFFKSYGAKLETVQIEWCDAAFTDDSLEWMVTQCPNIRRLKIKFCRKVTAACLDSIKRLEKLEHLSLRPSTSPEASDILPVIKKLGIQLRTISLENCPDVDNAVVDAIRAQCGKLQKLRLSDAECISDACMASLFSTEPGAKTSLPPLRTVDFSNARDVNANQPAGPEEDPIGLASTGFRALMSHSATKIKSLDISSCRHISHAAFCDVFNRDDGCLYPELEHLNVTFCAGVDTAVIKGIFACCPKLRRVIAFGCFNIEDVMVPDGVAVIGVPRAQDAIEKHGEKGVDVKKALGFMSQLLQGAA